MSTADDAWQANRALSHLWLDKQEAFIHGHDEGYRRALEDAADEIRNSGSVWQPHMAIVFSILQKQLVGTKDGDDEAPHVHQWRTFRPYNQPAYQSCAGCGNVIPAPKDDR